MSKPFDHYSEEPGMQFYAGPPFGMPHEMVEPLHPSAPTETGAQPGRYDITPHDEVGDDSGATDIEPETPFLPSPLANTERTLGVSAAAGVVESLEPVRQADSLQEPLEPATEPTLTPAGPPRAPYEIRRTESHTVLVNIRHPNPELAEQAAAELHDGVPSSWPKFSNNTGSSPGYRVDNAENPTLFVKLRNDARQLQARVDRTNDFYHNEDRRVRNFEENEERRIDAVALERRRGSISGEMRLAPEVGAVLRDEKAQEIAQDAGFASVDLVEPLAAVIDAQTGRRATVYPWQEGISEGAVTMRDPAEQAAQVDRLYRVSARLAEHLNEQGIEATDLRYGNTITYTDAEGNEHLRVIDTDRYSKIPREIPETPPIPETVEQSEAPSKPSLWLPPEAAMQTGLPVHEIQQQRAERYEELGRSVRETGRYQRIETAQREEGIGIWGPSDADLVEGRESFNEWFKGALPAGETNIKDYIQETLANIPPSERVAIEIGGPGSQLFKGFDPGYFGGGTLGTTLTDYRKPETIADDATRGHQVIAGDLMTKRTSQKVDEWLGDRKANLIIERMFMGISALPQDPLILGEKAAEWYDRLTPNGILLAHVPPALADHIKPWREYVRRNYPGLDVQFAATGRFNSIVVRIHKLPDAPEKLPLLPAKFILWREANSPTTRHVI